MREQSGYLELSDRGVYATAYLPETQASLGVVVIEPLGEEKRGGYRMFVRLCRQLASQGIAALRFDLSGTGDSTLPHNLADVDIWCEDARTALSELAVLSGCQQLALVGARGGALIAGKVASEARELPVPLSQLVLVEPWFVGSDCLTDFERRESIKAIMSGGGDRRSAQDHWQAGEIMEFGGYGFNAKLAEGLAAIDLTKSLTNLETIRVTGIRVSPSKRLPPVWACLGDRATIVTDKPFWGQLDYYESDIVNDAILQQLIKQEDH